MYKRKDIDRLSGENTPRACDKTPHVPELPSAQIQKNIRYIISRLVNRKPGSYTMPGRLSLEEVQIVPPGTIVSLEEGFTLIEVKDKHKLCDVKLIDSYRMQTGERGTMRNN